MLCEAHGAIYVWERVGSRVALTAYPLEQVSDLETGEILLFSWITIGGVTQTGEVSATTIEFNTATGRHLAPFVNMIRPVPEFLEPAASDTEQAKFNFLADKSFKFANYARHCLVQGERVHQVVWQPRISKPLTRLWKFTLNQTLALAHLAILTDKELIVIQDDERSNEKRGVRYGGKWRYVPLKHIDAATTSAQGEDIVTLSLTFAPGGRRLDVMFTGSREPEVARLQSGIETLKGH